MKDKIYIDGIDIFAQYGVFIVEGGYNGILSFPSMKTPELTNDWLEEDGIEVDLSETFLDTKACEIKFAAINERMTGDFLKLISDGAYHTFDLREIGHTCKLRLASSTNIQLFTGAETFSLTFWDDFPLVNYEYMEPLSSVMPIIQGYGLDGVDFSVYGIQVLEGSDAQILKTPAVKQNLLRNIPNLNGAIYDGETVVFKTKEVTLNCCLIANSLAEFWRNYNAFLYDLIRVKNVDDNGMTIQSGERTLFAEATYEEYPCYYRSSKVSLWDPSGKDFWCKFTLTLVFTSFRVGEQEYLLATEGGELIVTEDDEFYIDIKKYGN